LDIPNDAVRGESACPPQWQANWGGLANANAVFLNGLSNTHEGTT
jgi:hypothetical protein